MADQEQAQDVVSEHEHPRSGARFVVALVALMALTLLSFGMHYIRLGTLGTVIALTIAGIKVVVVGLIFMELRESLAATRLIPVVTILFVILLCLGIVGDVAFR